MKTTCATTITALKNLNGLGDIAIMKTVCQRCKTVFDALRINAKYCSDCKVIVRRQQSRDYQRWLRDKTKKNAMDQFNAAYDAWKKDFAAGNTQSNL